MNKKLLLVTLWMLLITAHPAAYALGVSGITLNSSLNQPLDARVDILSARPDELDNLNISVSRLAGGATVSKWPRIKVELVRADKGNSYLKITSKDAIREPVLNFLLELDWSEGRIKREYSLLVDPQL